ncbi:hypothetical protein BJ741DRAFT_669061 [Chytriomyces cf. hyalinus JEL632]|nr:hypothetical protein BJ741DRAFT_669061 [Chytriomyces cf. hyalinus JEL632]
MDIGDYKQATEFFIGAPLTNISVPKYALLFGWIGGSFKNVEKYAQFYRKSDFTAYILLSPFSDMTSAANGTRALLILMTALHLFSNGGSIKLRHFLHCLDARNVKLNTTAGILNSCPGRASLEGGSHFVTLGIKNSVARIIARNGVYAAYRMCMAVNAGFAAAGLPFKDVSKHPIEIAAPCAVSEKNPDGNVTGPRGVEACKAEGIVEEEKMFVGSEHVKHAVVRKEEYWSLVAAFLERWC